MVSAELPDNWQELLAGYILGNLSDDEALIVDRLLSEHPHLWQEVEAFQTSFDSLATTVPLRQPSEQLRERIFTAAQSSPRPTKRRSNWIAGIGGAIAATALLILGWRIATLNTQLQQANARIETLERDLDQANLQAQTVQPVLNTLQQPGTLIYSLQGSDRANAASGSLVMSAQTNQVIILVQNLPEPPSGKIYRLWAKVPTETTLAYCGQFNPNAQGFVQLTPSASVCGANPTQMLITIDAITDPTTKGGPVIMQSRT
ncbi:anti-sigma factor domain-containing protein [Leptolyngbya sp. AN03gr2]|uniref:anti-sigma factor domain-containing protein n=1 Tax=unclassified Leptolyngbya TaxID=2650499 RepID=UPI003D311A61